MRRWRELGSRLPLILIGLPRNKRISAQSPGAHEPKKDLVPAACEGRLSLSEGDRRVRVATGREFSTATTYLNPVPLVGGGAREDTCGTRAIGGSIAMRSRRRCRSAS